MLCFKLVKSSVERWCDQCVFHGVETTSTTFLSLGLLISWGNSCPSDCWPWCDLTANTWRRLLDLSRHWFMGISGPEWFGPPPRSNWWVTQTTATISKYFEFPTSAQYDIIWYAYLSATFLHQEKDCLWVGIGNAARMKRCVSRTEGSRSHSWKHI